MDILRLSKMPPKVTANQTYLSFDEAKAACIKRFFDSFSDSPIIKDSRRDADGEYNYVILNGWIQVRWY